MAVGGDQAEDVIEFTAQAGVADRRGTDQELLSNLTESAELFLHRSFGSWCTTGRCAWPPVVVVVEDDLSGCGQQMFGNHLTGGGFGDQEPLTVLDEGHGGADEPVGYRVAGRGVPDTREAIDLTGDRRWTDLGPQRWQLRQHFSFHIELLSRHAQCVAVAAGVDLDTPVPRGPVRCVHIQLHVVTTCGDLGFGPQRLRQIRLRVPAQVFHDPFRFRIGAVTEVRGEPVVGGKPHIRGGRYDDVGDDPTFEAAHPISEYLVGYSTDLFQRLGDESECGGGCFVGGEPNEPPA